MTSSKEYTYELSWRKETRQWHKYLTSAAPKQIKLQLCLVQMQLRIQGHMQLYMCD